MVEKKKNIIAVLPKVSKQCRYDYIVNTFLAPFSVGLFHLNYMMTS